MELEKPVIKLGITEEGQVYWKTGPHHGRRLGHIACVLNHNHLRKTATGDAVEEYWKRFLEANEPEAAFVPIKDLDKDVKLKLCRKSIGYFVISDLVSEKKGEKEALISDYVGEAYAESAKRAA